MLKLNCLYDLKQFVRKRFKILIFWKSQISKIVVCNLTADQSNYIWHINANETLGGYFLTHSEIQLLK